MKGLPEPIEVFELHDPDRSCEPPKDAPKAYRVLAHEGAWLPVVQIRHGLPAERDSLVGRDRELHSLAKLFDEGARLVTVLGIGGIGKTSLALAYARRWLGDYEGGAWFCDLAAATTPDGLFHAVANGLDVQLGKGDPADQLAAVIQARGTCLLIFDNFEQLAPEASAMLDRWLNRAPALRALVTSRAVLGLSGERAFWLDPLGPHDARRLFERLRSGRGGWCDGAF